LHHVPLREETKDNPTGEDKHEATRIQPTDVVNKDGPTGENKR